MKPIKTQIEELEEGCFRGWKFNREKGYCHSETLCPKCESKLQTLKECKKMFDDYNEKLKIFVNGRNAENINGELKDCNCDVCQIARFIDKLSKEMLGTKTNGN